MKKIAFLFTLSVILFGVTAFAQTTSDYTRYVDPFIGTGGHGHTFPGAVMPFGMVQLSPDTREANWDGSSGYHYSDDIIYGFSHTHLSGTGIPDGCDILFMPVVGEPQFFAKAGDKSVNGYASKFSHATEKAEPGYYSVTLGDDGTLAEMTSTKRVGLHRYTFNKSGTSSVIVDLTWRDKLLDGELRISGNRIEGFRRSSSWAKDQVVYFVAEFSLPVKNSKFGPRMIGIEDGKVALSKLKSAQAGLSFEVNARVPLLVKVAISPVSIEGARKNLAAELPGWNFDKVRADAKTAWNKELSKIEVSGGTPDQMTTFYTALYHTMIHPSLFNDVDGSYRGLDGKIHNINDSVATSPNRRSENYSVFSLWDTFRAAHPLYTIIDQKRTVDFINTFLRMYEQGGRLPVWELWGNETDTMIGYHAVSVIADAMAKGIKGFDYQKAYEAAKHSAELDHFGLEAYKKRGYISSEDENESVSKTLEYAYDDYAVARIAMEMCRELGVLGCDRATLDEGHVYHADNTEWARRAASYQNLFDKQTGFMRPRKNGGWISPFQPNEVTFHFTEGNSWQYSFFVPQDVNGLIELYGGEKKFAAKLDELFTTEQKLSGREQPDITGLIGQYAHGNEPSHHIPYLFNYAGQPWKTQKYVRRIMDEFYKNSPDGLIGNEDCGQMSAWYILSALGFYPVTPSDPTYQIGSPLFKKAKINLENGKTFTILAPAVSPKNIYVSGFKLNGEEPFLTPTTLEHKEIMRGGVLEFEMSAEHEVPRETEEILDFKTSALGYIAVPVINGPGKILSGKSQITLESITPGASIFYTFDGSQPTKSAKEYKTPFFIENSTTVKAVALTKVGQSLVAEANFYRRANNWTVKLESNYSYQYTGGGSDAIIDGLRGTANFASGEWQGYQGKDFVATIDLQKETEIRRVGGGFLQVARSWIWMPTYIEFEVSPDGVNFTKVADMKTDVPQTEMEPTKRDFAADISPVKARYVRAHAYNLGKIPSWHPGAGGDPWIFVDEILIN